MLLVLSAGAADAATFNVFGPQPFTRANGAPAVTAVSFAARAPGAGYTLRVESSSVSSAVITLNGADVFGTHDFNQQVTTLQKIVPLAASNTLSVELRGGPDEGLTVRVTGVDNDAPAIVIVSPADNATVSTSNVTIIGTVSDAMSGVAAVACGQNAATVEGNNFTCSATLVGGTNSVLISATDVAGNTGTQTLTLRLSAAPQVRILSPENLSFVNLSPITVRGTVSDSSARVRVGGIDAPVSDGSFSVQVPLVEGNNTLTAVAESAGFAGTANVQVTLDTTPPHVNINSPANGFVTSEPAISVAGMINDIVVGTVNDQQAQVTVNGVAAQVANRSFLAQNVPLTEGDNLIQVVGRDRVGNAYTAQITVRRLSQAQAQIRTVSGDGQSGTIGSVLAQPLIVQLVDALGQPAAGRQVVFKVTQSDGSLADATGAARGSIVAVTDPQGRAQARWTLGLRAGAGNNRVEAAATGFAGTALFAATVTPGPAAAVHLDAGSGQTGATGEALPFPFVVVVTDAGHNRLGGVPVTFLVREGGGTFGGGMNTTVAVSDSDGRALAVLTLGVNPGYDNNLVEATVAGSTTPVIFNASARVPGPAADTRISGVVVDNSNNPIPGATIRLYRAYQASNSNIPVPLGTPVVTDAQGKFTIAQAPVGALKLVADGTTVQGTSIAYPTVEYDLVAISGTDNTVGSPIYLPVLDTVNRLCVSPTIGGTLTLPSVPGFAFTVAPGSATFPGGSRTGCITVTPVHSDKVPMVPGFGQQPRFVVTIQPAGTHFNPPAQIAFPNVDGLAPRQVTEMYSYDHDLSTFVAIGTGTVTADGAVIKSDPGVGVLKAGWHCGGNPAPTGAAANCPECKKCVNKQCVADVAKQCKPCTGNKLCNAGQCNENGFTVNVATPSNDGKTPDCDKSFVSDDTLTFTGSACTLAGTIDWKSDNTGANGTLTPSTGSGPSYAAKPTPPAAPDSRAAKLQYTVTATLAGKTKDTVVIQDEIDKIRQQYIDMNKTTKPLRAPFINSGQSSGGHFTFAEIQSNDGAPWALFSIFENMETWRTNYGAALALNRGYTTPRHNASIPGAATNSQHIYGTAADVASSSADWQAKRDAAKLAGACCEPLSVSGAGHVHGDWRGACPAGW